MSLPEVLLWNAIKGRKLAGLHFRKQHPVRLAVEVDGASHGFRDRPTRDVRRDAWLRSQGIESLRLSAELAPREVDDATRTILGHLEDRQD